MTDKFGDERRKYHRIHKHFVLKYYDLNDPLARYDASQLKNISVGGMCLVTSRPFTADSRLGVELKTPFLAEFIHLEGTVLSSTEKIKGIIYETRLRFDQMTPTAQTVLQKLIEHFELEEKNRHE